MLTLPQAREMVRATDLNLTQRFLLMVIASYTNGSPACYPSITELSEVMHANRRTVQRALGELEGGGYITVTPSAGGGCNTYRVTAHPEFPPKELQNLQQSRGGTVPPPAAERRPEVQDLGPTSGTPTTETVGPSTSGRQSAAPRGTAPPPPPRDVTPDPVEMSKKGAATRWRRALITSGDLRQSQTTLPQRILQAIERGELPDGATFRVPEAGPVAAATFVREQVSIQGGQRYPTAAEKASADWQNVNQIVRRRAAEVEAKKKEHQK